MSWPVATFMNTLFPKIKAVTRALVMALCLSVQGAALKVGDSIPNLSEFKFEGSMPELQGRIMLIDFWASWCAPCKESFPVMKELHEKFSTRGFVILAISVDEEKSAMQAFLKKNLVPFAIVRDPAGKAPEAFGAGTMPTSFVIGADGKITAIHNGFEGKTTRKQYIEQIEAALKAAGK